MLNIRPLVERHKHTFTLIALILISIILLALSNTKIEEKPKEIAQTFFSLFQTAATKILSWFRDKWNSINELKRVKEELESVRKKLVEHERLSQDRTELRLENNRLRLLLQFVETSEMQQIPAEVIAKDPENFFPSITVNKGVKHGVEKHMPVVAYQNGLKGLVGKITYTGRSSSMITPLFDPGSYVSARFQKTRDEGLVNGNGTKTELILRYIKKEAKEEISYGDIAITSGLGGIYPKGIHIGMVKSFHVKPYETSMTLILEPVVDFSKLEYVFILTPEEE